MHRKLLSVHSGNYSLIYQILRSVTGFNRHIINLSHHPLSLRSSPPATNLLILLKASIQASNLPLRNAEKSIGQSLKMPYISGFARLRHV